MKNTLKQKKKKMPNIISFRVTDEELRLLEMLKEDRNITIAALMRESLTVFEGRYTGVSADYLS